jgi:membrane protein required for colicin V production
MMDTIANNGFDIAVALTLFLGALIGLAVGFVRGGLFVMSWLGAAFVTVIGFTTVRPYARSYIENQMFADIAGGAALFVGTLIVLFLVSSILGGWVRASRLNALDRSLGMVAGLATAALAIAGGYMGAEHVWATPEEQPKWMAEARSTPLIRTSAYMLNDALPPEFKLMKNATAQRAAQESRDLIERKKAFDRLIQPSSKDADARDREGYGKKERGGMDQLIDRAQ